MEQQSGASVDTVGTAKKCSAEEEGMEAEASTLTYTDSHGNAEIIRLMLAVCGEPWQDKVALDPEGAMYLHRREHFDRMAAAGILAFDQFPLLRIDGLNLVQKHAAVRYLARKHGLYGTDNADATQVDIVFDSLVDFAADGDARKQEKQDKYLPRIERVLRASEGGYLVGGALSLADVQLFYVLDYVAGGDEVPNPFWGDGSPAPADFLSAYPRTAAHCAMMQGMPRLSAYLAGAQRLPRAGPKGWVDRVKATIPHLFEGRAYPMTSETWHYRSAPS